LANTLIANLSDFQSGSTTALFPDREWEGEHQFWKPTINQKMMHAHFLYCADLLRNRGNSNLIIVNSGDAIDGNHHGTHQLITRIINEQVAIHEELMQEFMERCGFSLSNGDRLIYVRGTEVHTGEEEAKIAADLGAEISDHVELIINGYRLWFIHDGASSGSGPNEGNSLRNKLRDIYYTCLDDSDPIPDLVAYAHVHVPVKNIFMGHRKKIWGYINPSWQMKTRFAYKVAPVVKTKIGMTVVGIMDDWGIQEPCFHILKTESAKSVIMQETNKQEI